MPYLLSEKLQPNFLKYVVSNYKRPLLGSDHIILKCAHCDIQKTLTFRAVYRKWGNKNEYLCKSCHVKTYISDEARLAKFRTSFAKISGTPEHKIKCSNAAKKLWADPIKRAELISTISKDNKNNPLKAKAREKAREALRNKDWYQHHMSQMRGLSILATKSTKSEFVQKASQVHEGMYDYSKVVYHNENTKVIIICLKHGEFKQSPHGHLQGRGCSKCATTISKAHMSVLGLFPDGVEVKNNVRDVIAPLEIDIWVPEHNFGVEIHGEYWHGVGQNTKDRKRTKNLHSLKASYAEEMGIRLLQFWQTEIDAKQDIVKSMIANSLGLSTRFYARKCELVEVSNKDITEFFEQSHLQGHRNASVNYALSLNGIITCALSISKHAKHDWEIIRFANRVGSTTVGGFSRILKRFITDYNPQSILTFADRRYSQGKLYAQFFNRLCTTKPNYFYFKHGDSLSRQQCQKHKLQNRLGDVFDPTQTEVQNMLMAGYVQVFDAGHIKFLWSR